MVEKGGILLGRKMAEYYKGGQQNLGREFNRISDRKTKHGTGRVYDRRAGYYMGGREEYQTKG
jgi:hypothetical protein